MAKIIVTIGPSSIARPILLGLREAGANSFRINLSHSNKSSLAYYFDEMLSCGITPAIDTQGAQLRVEELNFKTDLELGAEINILFGKTDQVVPIKPFLRLNHPEASDQVSKGDIMRVDFTGLALELKNRVSEQSWQAEVVAQGGITLNRAVDIKNKSIDLSILTKFDEYAIEYALDRGTTEVYTSFASSAADVNEVRKFIGRNTVSIISKIETSLGVANAEEIALNSDEILIDRGDLSREINIPTVPLAVSGIARISKHANTPVNVATNILDSMISQKVPSRAEISDIFSLLEKGIDGFVLAAEVAIGQNPVQSTALVNYLIKLYQNHRYGLYGIGSPALPSEHLIGKELLNWL